MKVADFITQAQEHQKGKVCTKCKEYKLFSEFYTNKIHKDGFEYQCKSCYKEYGDNMCPFKKWFISKKAHAKMLGIEFIIEPTARQGQRAESSPGGPGE